MHFELLVRDGGLRGLKDENALESALTRPRHRWTYEPDADLLTLGAAYGFGLVSSHAYSDGNKRIALAVMYTFLGMNGLEIDASEPEVVQLVVRLAAGEMSETQLTAWLRTHVIPFVE